MLSISQPKRTNSQSTAMSDAESHSDPDQSKVSVNKRRKTAKAFVPVFKQDLSSDSDHSGTESDGDSDSGSNIEDAEQDLVDGEDASGSFVFLGSDAKSKRRPRSLALTKEELEAHNALKALTGVVYISKVPPFMKPQKVKHLLSDYGETGRIFLAPEDQKTYAKRVKYGGNKRRMFTEGWIEFVDKRKARLVAETLNARKIGGKKGSFYHDDLWNLKYLPKFKWDDLTAQIAAENASRQIRLAAEIEQGKRESKHYLKTAERAKMIKNIQTSRASAAATTGKVLQDTDNEGMRRTFHQRDARDNTKPVTKSNDQATKKMSKVMDSIFG